MRYPFILIAIVAFTLHACSQGNPSQPANTKSANKKIGGGCEGCDAIYASPVPFEKLNWIDTLPDYNEPGPKLVVSGVVFQPDGKTPAKDVVLYVYHTDQTGHYTNKFNEQGSTGRNGYVKGWMKTNARGEYKFYTLKPAAYPGTNIPSHIHPLIKEPDKNEYWIDEYLFDDDPFLTPTERKKQEGRGGSGILITTRNGATLEAHRNIYLGRNIPGYPAKSIAQVASGLSLGANCPAFDPIHLSGADKGKHTCPMCKYGYGQGVMVWFNHTSLDRFKRFAKLLEAAMRDKGEKQLRVFFVYENPAYNLNDAEGLRILRSKIEKWCEEQDLQKLAMLWVPSPVDEKTSAVFKINPKAENTILLYKNRKVAAKWVNIDYSDEWVTRILHELGA